MSCLLKFFATMVGMKSSIHRGPPGPSVRTTALVCRVPAFCFGPSCLPGPSCVYSSSSPASTFPWWFISCLPYTLRSALLFSSRPGSSFIIGSLCWNIICLLNASWVECDLTGPTPQGFLTNNINENTSINNIYLKYHKCQILF